MNDNHSTSVSPENDLINTYSTLLRKTFSYISIQNKWFFTASIVVAILGWIFLWNTFILIFHGTKSIGTILDIWIKSVDCNRSDHWKNCTQFHEIVSFQSKSGIHYTFSPLKGSIIHWNNLSKEYAPRKIGENIPIIYKIRDSGPLVRENSFVEMWFPFIMFSLIQLFLLTKSFYKKR